MLVSFIEDDTIPNSRFAYKDGNKNVEQIIDSLIEAGKKLRYMYQDEALEVLDKGKVLSLESGLTDKLIECNIIQSTVYIVQRNLDTASIYIDSAIYIADSVNEDVLLADAYRLKAMILRKSDFMQTALEYLRKSIEKLDNRDSMILLKIYDEKGIIFSDLSLFDSATYYMIKAIDMEKALHLVKETNSTLINLANVFNSLKDYTKAKYLLNECLNNLSENSDDYYYRVKLVYMSLGRAYYWEGKYDSAFYYFRASESICKKTNNYVGLLNAYSNTGALYHDLGDNDSALFFYNKAKKIGKEHSINMSGVYNNISLVNLENKNYKSSLANLDTAISIASKTGKMEDLSQFFLNKCGVYKDMGDYKNAFIYLYKHKELSDSLYDIQKSKLISDLEMKYEKEKDRYHILSLKNENLQQNIELDRRTNQRNIIFGGGSGIIIISIMLFAFYRQRVKKDKIIAAQRIEKLEREKKLLAAKSIVEGQEEERKRIARELHDGLGVLLSTAKMQFKTIEDKSPENSELIKKASALLEKASTDVRRISHNMMPGILTKLGLDEALEDIFENVNDTPGINAVLNIENEGDKRLLENTEIMIYRIVQEMVNNMLKYAGASKVTLDVIYDDDIVSIRFADNGSGFNVEEKMKNKSIGLTSIQSRVNFLGGKININSKEGRGTTFFINIPV